jgi:hypothetical protein
MTQDEIIRMALDTGILEPIDLLPSNQWRQDTIRELDRFANLVAKSVIKQFEQVGTVNDFDIDWLEGVTDNEAPNGSALYVRNIK